MAVAFRAYFDGSGSPAKGDRGPVVALAGYAATPDVWTDFEADWWSVLADDTHRPACRCLHMKDANALRGEFSTQYGWSHEGVRRLLADLFNRCFAPRGLQMEPAEALIGASCWVDLDAYERVCQQYPHFRAKSPQALCVDHVVGTVLRLLVPDPDGGSYATDLVARGESVDLFFDRKEPFRREIQRVWEARPWRQRSAVLKLVRSLNSTSPESSAALQAADFLAWHTNRDLRSEPGDLAARLMMWLATRCVPQAYDYEELARTAAGWKHGAGYGAAP